MAVDWPYALITPRGERARLSGVSLTGGQSVGGVVQSVRLDGGGLWVIEQTYLLHDDKVKVARAVANQIDGGTGTVNVRVSEQTYAPAALAESEAAFSDGTEFSDGTGFATVPPGATVATAAALRATTLEVTPLTGVSFKGGERFSIAHTTKGRRLYEIVSVGDGALTIRPPLREAVDVGVELDFLRPSCVCRLANPEEFMGALGPDRIVETTAVWVEAFD